MPTGNTFLARATLQVGPRSVDFYRVGALKGAERLPFALRILAENLLRNHDLGICDAEQIHALMEWAPGDEPSREIQFTPARVLMQDFTGVPCLVDLAAMREAVADLEGDPGKVNPVTPAEMVVDHSLVVDHAGDARAERENVAKEYGRNAERYQFLRWGQGAFDGLRVVPPGNGIVHQVNLEHLARGVVVRDHVAFPDTCVGTDSHTTMVGGLGILGWGVGGIEAEAAMLGQPISLLIPKVVGFKLIGSMRGETSATDVVLRITEMLRRHGVVGAIVEFHGRVVGQLPLAHRATISNMCPEFGSTAAIFPIDEVTREYYRLTGRDEARVQLIEAYARAQGLWHNPTAPSYVEPAYSESLELDLSSVVPSIAGPRRPQDRIELSRARRAFRADLPSYTDDIHAEAAIDLAGEQVRLAHGLLAIAAITSCTNTSNPSAMIGAGLLARNALAKGLSSKPWVKTSLAPGSKVVTAYLERSGLSHALDALGFHVVGYGCTTCIGNSGPLAEEVSAAIHDEGIVATAVLSGNRNFEGRINPDVAMNYLASPGLVVAYALAGTLDFDFAKESLGLGPTGQPVFLADIWPGPDEIAETLAQAMDREMYLDAYEEVFTGDESWRALPTPGGARFAWDPDSTYLRKPPYFEKMTMTPEPWSDIVGARVLALLSDSVTTDHISPAGAIKADSPAGRHLAEHGVAREDFNSYGSRRGNHEVMVRGAFANIRLRNLMVEVAGGYTLNHLTGEVTTIFEAAEAYAREEVPLVVLAGKEYGTGSSRDWAAKGTSLLGVKAVIAESFERIHRSNLIGMGVLPLQFLPGASAASLGLDGHESYDILWPADALDPLRVPETMMVKARGNGDKVFRVLPRIDTPGELEYFRNGGILPTVVRSLVAD